MHDVCGEMERKTHSFAEKEKENKRKENALKREK